jgi:hypothetical protein
MGEQRSTMFRPSVHFGRIGASVDLDPEQAAQWRTGS